MSSRTEVLMWAQRVKARKGQPAHVLLELRADATGDDVQAAFHKIARTSHPDLHRHGLTPDEIEMVTSAYATVAGAYQELRNKTMQTTRMKPVPRTDAASTPATGTPSQAPPAASRTVTASRTGTPPPTSRTVTASRTGTPPPQAATPSGAGGSTGAVNPAQAMSQKALLYYHKAESALKRGDLKGAILQLKLACATDPTSVFLRSALAEVETEVRKST